MLAAPITVPLPPVAPPPVVPTGLGGTGQPTAYTSPYGAMHIGNADMPGIGPRNRFSDLQPVVGRGRRRRRAGATAAHPPEVHTRPAPQQGSHMPFVAQFLVQAVMTSESPAIAAGAAAGSYQERNLSDQLPPSRGWHRRMA